VSVAIVAQIELYRMAGHQAAHDSGDRCQTGFQKQMDVIGHQGPGITNSGRFGYQGIQAFDKIIAIVGVPEYSVSFYSANNYMM
jgi:hypothetical protein